jgi:hypothetical protein
VNSPVGAAGLDILPGTVQWVVDPDAVGAQPRVIVGTLFRQHRVAGAGVGKGFEDVFVRQAVRTPTEIVRPGSLAPRE